MNCHVKERDCHKLNVAIAAHTKEEQHQFRDETLEDPFLDAQIDEEFEKLACEMSG